MVDLGMINLLGVDFVDSDLAFSGVFYRLSRVCIFNVHHKFIQLHINLFSCFLVSRKSMVRLIGYKLSILSFLTI